MQTRDFATTFVVDQTPDEVFAAINNVRGWWLGDIEGSTNQLGDEFTLQQASVQRRRPGPDQRGTRCGVPDLPIGSG